MVRPGQSGVRSNAVPQRFANKGLAMGGQLDHDSASPEQHPDTLSKGKAQVIYGIYLPYTYPRQ